MALSPNGKNIASGSVDGTVRLWDVEMGKVVHKWKAHPEWVKSVCWSPNGERVVSGSNDGTTRVWDAKSGEPGAKMIATGVQDREIEIWDAKTGKRLSTIKLDEEVFSLAWTSDENKLIAGLSGSIRILDTATWQQIADLDGHSGTGNDEIHENAVYSLTLFPNDRLLASASYNGTVRLWNLDTNLQVGPPLQHEASVMCAAFSADGKLLSTACYDGNAYLWDIYAILKAAGLEDLLSDAQKSKKSLSDANATRRPPIRPTPHQVPQGFFDGVQNRDPSPQRRHHSFAPSWGLHPRALLAHLPQPFHHSQPNADESIELQQRPGPSTSPRRSPSIVEVPCIDDKKALYVAWRLKPASHNAERIKNAKWWARVVLFICCVSTSTEGGH